MGSRTLGEATKAEKRSSGAVKEVVNFIIFFRLISGDCLFAFERTAG